MSPDIKRPPCWSGGSPCPNPCAGDHYRRVVYNSFELSGEWSGWRFSGPYLINPHGERINRIALDRLMYREQVLYRR